MREHTMVEVSEIAGEHLFSCETMDCGRHVAFRPADLSITVLAPGDVFARHVGSTAPDVLSMSISPTDAHR